MFRIIVHNNPASSRKTGPMIVSQNGNKREARFITEEAALEAARIIHALRTDSVFEGTSIEPV